MLTTRLMIVTVVLISCLAAQHPAASLSPTFARYGIRAVTEATPEGDAELTARLGPDA